MGDYVMTIDGQAVPAEQTFGVINPATGDVFAQAPECTREQLDAAMESAHKAQLKTIKAAGVAILLVEQNLEVCIQLADRHCIVEQGAMVYNADNAAFLADEAIKDRYLGVGLA